MASVNVQKLGQWAYQKDKTVLTNPANEVTVNTKGLSDWATKNYKPTPEDYQAYRKKYYEDRLQQAIYAPSTMQPDIYQKPIVQVPISEQPKQVSDVEAFFQPIGKGISDVTGGIYAGLEAGTKFLDKLIFGSEADYGATLFKPIHDIYKIDVESRKSIAETVEKSQYGRGDWYKYYAMAGEGVGSAIPSAVLAVMSGGTSLAAQGTISTTAGLESAAAAAQAVNLGTKAATLNTIRTGITTMSRDPLMWTNFMQTAGQSYEQAKQSGASEDRALTTGILSGLLQSGIEVSGGTEALPAVLKGIKGASRQTGAKIARQWVSSALQEGNEEIAQNVLDGLLQKIIADPSKQLFSWTDPNAAISVKSLIEAYGTAVFAGGVLGGGQIGTQQLIGKAVSTKAYQDYATGVTVDNLGIRDQVLQAGLNAPEDSQINNLASKLFEKAIDGKPVSNRELGQLYNLMAAETAAETPAAIDLTGAQAVPPAQAAQAAAVQAAAPAEAATQTNQAVYNAALNDLNTRTHTKAGAYNVRLNTKSDGTVTASITNTETGEKTQESFATPTEARVFAAAFVSQEAAAQPAAAPAQPAAAPAAPNVGIPAVSAPTTITSPSIVQPQVAVQQQAAAQIPSTIVETQAQPSYNVAGQPLANNPQTRWGDEDTTYTNNNQPIQFNYAIVPAESLITSNDRYGGENPAYPQELQPRDRSRVASQLQIEQMSKNLNPRRLTASAEAQNGAPIVRPDGVVVSGNGRALAISAAYDSGSGQIYSDYLQKNADRLFGVSGALPDNPVLIRVPTENQDWPSLARQLNETTTATFSATENAMTDAQKMGDILDLFVANDEGNLNTAANSNFRNQFIERVVPQAERGNMITPTGSLSLNGLERVQNAIFAAAYNDPALSARLSEIPDADAKNVTNALVNTAPNALVTKRNIENGTSFDLNFVDDVVQATQLYAYVKSTGQPMADYLAQTSLTNDYSAEAEAIAQFMEANKASAKKMTDFINRIYNNLARLDPNQETLFGGNTDATKQAVLTAATKEYIDAGNPKIGFNLDEYGVRSVRGEAAGGIPEGRGGRQPIVPAAGAVRAGAGGALRTAAAAAAAPAAPAPTLAPAAAAEPVAQAGESIGAATAGFAVTPYSQYVGEAPTYPVGEIPVRIVPVKTTDSKTAQTIMEAGSIPEAFVPKIQQGLMDGLFKVVTKSDAGAKAAAIDTIERQGIERARDTFVAAARSGKVSKKDVALGAQLIVSYANAGADETALDVMVDYYKVISTGAQILQAAKILKRLDPNSQLYYIQSSIGAINEQINDKAINKSVNSERNARESSKKTAEVMTKVEDDAREIGNVPLDEWPFRTGMQLGQKLQNYVKGGSQKARAQTMTQLILTDLVHFADLSRQQAGRKPKTTEDRISDYVNNEEYYFEAWQAAQEQLYVKYGDDKEALALYEDWLNKSIEDAVSESIGRKRAARTPSTPKTLSDKIIGMVKTGGFQYESLRGAMNDYIFGADSNITIDPIMAERYRKATTSGERDTILDEIYADLGSQVPANLADKWNAWRYLGMLGSFKTHFRNTIGNTTFLLPKGIKNLTATALESIFIHDPTQRTKSILNPRSEKDRTYAQNSWADFQNVMDTIMEPGKYDTATSKITENMTVFKTKWLEKMRKFNVTALNAEDTWFSQPAYARALARYMKAQGMNPVLAENTEAQVDAARVYAIKEAQKATYRDRNAFSDYIAKLGKGVGNKNSFAHLLVEGVLPFKRTPANILVRAFEYSPAGLAKTVFYDSWRLARGQISAADYIDKFAAGLTGTMLTGLGVWLRAAGILMAAPPDDEDEKDMNKLTGRQNYSINVFGQSIPVSVFAPAIMPVFVGAELHDIFTSEKGATLTDILAAVGSLADPIVDMSMLDGVQNALETVKYSDNALTTITGNLIFSYLSQGLPTLLGQIEGIFEPERTQTYIDPNSGIPQEIQYMLGKVFEKIPFVDFQQQPYVDAFGRRVETGNILTRAINNLVNPFYANKIQETAVDRKIAELNTAGYLGTVPNAPNNDFSYKSKDYKMTGDEYTKFQETRGQTMYAQMQNMMLTPAFSKLTQEQQGEAFADIMEFATDEAKRELVTSRGDKYSSDWDDETNYSDLGTATAFKEAFAGMVDAVNEAKDNNKPYAGENSEAFVSLNEMYSSLTQSQKDDIQDTMKNKGFEDVMAALDANITTDQYYEAHDLYTTLRDDETLKADQRAEQFAYQLDMNLPELDNGQKAVLKERLNYFQMIPQEANRYADLTAAGISGDNALTIYNKLSTLTGTGKDGKPTIGEKRLAITNLPNLNDNQKLAVIKSYFPPSDTDTTYKKYATAYQSYGVDVTNATYYFNTADLNGNGAISEAEAKATLNAMNISNAQRGALFAMTSKTFTKAGGNPYGGPLYGSVAWVG